MIWLRHLPRRVALWAWAWVDEVQRWRYGRVSRAGARQAIRRACAKRVHLEAKPLEAGLAGVRFTVTPFRRRAA